MSSNFVFKTDEKSEEFCNQIAIKMVELFKITLEEAVGRINQAWANSLSIEGCDNIIYHEEEDFWAKTIYYPEGTRWWQQDESLLVPRPWRR